MSVQYANHTEIIDTDANNSVTVTPPASLASGNRWVILAAYDCDPGGSLGDPSGGTFSVHSTYSGNPGYYAHKIASKSAGASESNVTMALTGTDYDALVYSVRLTESLGAAIDIDAVGTPVVPSGTGASVDSPDITIGANGSLAIQFVATVPPGGMSNTFTAPRGTIRDSRIGAFVYPTGAFATEEVDAGAYSAGNWTYTDTSENGRAAQTLSFKPASGGGDTNARLIGGDLLNSNLFGRLVQ